MPRSPLIAAAALVLVAASLFVAPTPARAADARTEVRLLTAEGRFADARTLLAAADDEIKNDRELRAQLIDVALRYARQKEGDARRAGLEAGIEHVEFLVAQDPTDSKSGAIGIEACNELAELLAVAKNADGAKSTVGRGVSLGELCMKVETPDPAVMQMPTRKSASWWTPGCRRATA
jgi:hypothetical protein